jgi:hypothetical protein
MFHRGGRVSSKKNLIMGLWSRMTFEGLERFIGSLRRTTFHGDICVFVDEVSPETVGALLEHGIIVERADRLASQRMHAQSSRYFSYLDFLARNGASYANVMISDLRDVVFQSDPFEAPLPADIVFAQERCLLGESPVNLHWIADAYGAAVAHNLRDCLVSCSGTTFASVCGMLRYLVAMTTELSGLADRDVLLARGIDQGIHNYLVRMRPLRDAWCDPTDSLVATMHYVSDEAIQTTPDGILIDGRRVPVVHQWERNRITLDYVWAAPQFKLDAAQRTSPPGTPPPAPRPAHDKTQPPATRRAHAVVAFYHRPRDSDWLAPFVRSLRCVGYAGGLHCVGIFDDGELDLLSQHGCVAHRIDAIDPALDVENIAHLFIGRVLDRLAADAVARPDQVLVMDTVRAGFLRDPFHAETIGLSAFLEGATRIGESDYNLDRLAHFTTPDADMLLRPIVSSSLLRGRLDILRAFYRKLFAEFVGRAELLRVAKMIQGAVNKLCHGGGLDVPVILHPNGAEAYFEFWQEGVPTTTKPAIRVAGAVPFVVLNPVRESELMRAVRASLGIG